MNRISRRGFIASGASVAGLGMLAPRATRAQPAQFAGLHPLWPAPPITAQRGSVTPPADLGTRVYNKLAFGPARGDVAAFTSLQAWLDWQLAPTASDPDLDAHLDPADFPTLGKTRTQLWQDHVLVETGDGGRDWRIRNQPLWELELATMLRQIYSQWQLREVLADFWHNHFNVYGRDDVVRSMIPYYDGVVIRPHIFGNFRDMLELNARSASMLVYLDNFVNSWPNPNENYGREILELHTLGGRDNFFGAIEPDSVPDNNGDGLPDGYVQEDVVQCARAFTGWGLADSQAGAPNTGAFLFRSDWHYDDHDIEPIRVVGLQITNNGGEQDAIDVIDHLAQHRGTAEYICWKLCVRLIGDAFEPTDPIVQDAATVFQNNWQAGNQLELVYREILQHASQAFENTWNDKVKRPWETFIAGMRAADVDFSPTLPPHSDGVSFNRPGFMWGLVDPTGNRPFGWETPDGYPDEKAIWQGSGPFVMAWRAATWFLRYEENGVPIVNLAQQTNAVLASANRTPGQIADLWIARVLARALDPARRQLVVDFLAQGGDENAPIPNNDDTGHWSTYQQLIRAAVGMLSSSPEAMQR